MPSMTGILTSMMTRSGRELAGQLDRLLAVRRPARRPRSRPPPASRRGRGGSAPRPRPRRRGCRPGCGGRRRSVRCSTGGRTGAGHAIGRGLGVHGVVGHGDSLVAGPDPGRSGLCWLRRVPRVPRAGLEPARPFEQSILSAPCLPFHHPGGCGESIPGGRAGPHRHGPGGAAAGQDPTAGVSRSSYAGATLLTASPIVVDPQGVGGAGDAGGRPGDDDDGVALDAAAGLQQRRRRPGSAIWSVCLAIGTWNVSMPQVSASCERVDALGVNASIGSSRRMRDSRLAESPDGGEGDEVLGAEQVADLGRRGRDGAAGRVRLGAQLGHRGRGRAPRCSR